jgi:hypothetical protein
MGLRVSEVENLGTNQFVMQDDVGFADETQRFHGEKFRISGTCTD